MTHNPPSRDVSRELFEKWLHKHLMNKYHHSEEQAEEYVNFYADDDEYAAFQAGYEAAKGGGWMPIESAPKDGTEILGYWEYIYPGDDNKTYGRMIISWDGVLRCWESGDGSEPDLFTHWKFLDKPEQL